MRTLLLFLTVGMLAFGAGFLWVTETMQDFKIEKSQKPPAELDQVKKEKAGG
ncbi:hypothetical protein C8P63_11217 [Melghirimyces profundicolus]|uniref:Uncharacterized protein n=1 Tax=Melghirimyces profundicolus TaxID=1242148 RepID=A0A2T6BTD2_9BACL|nr:hypothetical protein [Melghirimyces profundicolus]PTX59323.1 hypothetical protein C8P63_11217 [Melghirimyces profundicolus]